MIKGQGLMAGAFAETYSSSERILIFAAGVSNSKETRESEFQREEHLLRDTLSTNDKVTFVYFSTCSIYDPHESKSPYVAHKLKMEQIVRTSSKDPLVLRVSNVVGANGNAATIFNFLAKRVKAQESFVMWRNAYRNLIDVDDVVIITKYIIENRAKFGDVVNVANPTSYAVPDLVAAMESHFMQPANCTIVDQGAYFDIDVKEIILHSSLMGLNFAGDYLAHLLSKYFPVNVTTNR